jgi:putative oxidoreductase
MNFVDLVMPETPGPRASTGILILRLVAGFAFIQHGWGKIQHPFGWMGPESAWPGWLQFLAAISEFGGGIAWILGLLMPLASFGILCTMAVAVGVHLSNGASFVGGERPYELAAVFFTTALLFLFAGPGLYSLDALIFGPRLPSPWSSRR